MVRDQLADCADARVIAVMAAAPREDFVPPDATSTAYADGALPIGSGQTISQPRLIARMLEALALRPGMRVLDVGCGSGYAAALLADLVAPGGSVIAVERIATLVEPARRRLVGRAVTVHHADGTAGWPAGAPYDAIHVAAAAPAVPEALLGQLAPGGRLVIPLEADDAQELWLFSDNAGTRLGPVRFVPFLPGMQA
jgi:protein-L-isoaspartate(D-aspartate) O-methyltransferase